MKRIYLDYPATMPTDPGVVRAMRPRLPGKFGNPSSIYPEGREGKRAVENARLEIAGLIRAEPEEIIFTSGT